jgi:hypothetical protein
MAEGESPAIQLAVNAEPPPIERLRAEILKAVQTADEGMLKRFKDVLGGPKTDPGNDRLVARANESSKYRQKLAEYQSRVKPAEGGMK